MKRLLLAALLALGALCIPRPADATACVIPYSFLPGTTIYSAQVNADFTAVANCYNTAIVASQIAPTSVGSGTFGAGSGFAGYTFGGYSAGVIPLTVNGASGQSVDLFDVAENSALVDWVDDNGELHNSVLSGTTSIVANSNIESTNGAILGNQNFNNAAGILASVGSGSLSAMGWNATGGGSDVTIATGAHTGDTVSFWYYNGTAYTQSSLITNAGTYSVGSSTFGATSANINGGLSAGTTSVSSLSSTGEIQTTGSFFNASAGSTGYNTGSSDYGPTSATVNGALTAISVQSKAGGSTAAWVPPVYSTAGAADANTAHIVRGSFATSLNGNCTQFSLCTLTANSVTLTNSAVFTAVNDYECTTGGGAGALTYGIGNNSGSTLAISAYNNTNATVTSGTAVSFSFICVGF